jgi:hypothetical protein
MGKGHRLCPSAQALHFDGHALLCPSYRWRVQEELGICQARKSAASLQIGMRSDAARFLNLHQQFTRFLQSMETVIDAAVLQ